MPYGTVNLKHGVPQGETPVTCAAGVGTFIIEFGTLSRLTGNPLFEDVCLLFRQFNKVNFQHLSLGCFKSHSCHVEKKIQIRFDW